MKKIWEVSKRFTFDCFVVCMLLPLYGEQYSLHNLLGLKGLWLRGKCERQLNDATCSFMERIVRGNNERELWQENMKINRVKVNI